MSKQKTVSTIRRELNPEVYYKPSEIAKKKWITSNGTGKASYYYILKLIRNGKINARNFGLGETNYYRIRGSEILKFLK